MPHSPQRDNPLQLAVDQVIRSKRKTLALIVKPDGAVVVLAALPPAPRQYVHGETFSYLGTSFPLKLVEGQREPLLLDDGTFKLAASQRHEAAAVFERWYREQARQVLTARVEVYAREYALGVLQRRGLAEFLLAAHPRPTGCSRLCGRS
jgi:predicted metal-dependent hydrolase